MFLDLTEIAEEPGKRWTLPIDFPPAPTLGLDFQDDAAGQVIIHNTGSSLVFSGPVTATLAATCARCLTPFRLRVQGTIEATVSVAQVFRLAAGKAVELDADLAAVFSAQGADLAELVRQALVLALPMRLLCSDRCKGLCPHCGKNLNTGPCSCKTAETDPRLQALSAWRKR